MESKQGNKIAGPSIPLRLEFVTFLSCVGVAVGKLPKASANKHRRGPSTPRHKASVCDRSAKRFAQDDGFVGGLECSWLGMLKHEKIEKVTGSRDDNSVEHWTGVNPLDNWQFPCEEFVISPWSAAQWRDLRFVRNAA